ncbi:hypothetical protein [Lysinibacillus parviboronicapiens]|uniref:hypothetical protein n=1 Tax=Lysinibacillus parviboronicapiens TaxID=436516 RepID=UPI000D34F591|nr:hypothetical protein [Lysinibacillus parviboronicapiens]
MYLDVVMRLSALGVAISSAPSSSDDMLLKHAIDKVTNHINSQTNLLSIPNGLKEIAIDMVVGEFLLTKKAMGLLDVETLNFEAVAKQVQDGDTNVVFAVEANRTPEAQFEAFILYLKHGNTDFLKYRVLTW